VPVRAPAGIAALAELDSTRVLVLTTYDSDEHVIAALRAGAAGFLVKDTRPADLLDAIRTIAAGESLLSPGPTTRLISRFLRHPETLPATNITAGLAMLSDRERQVLTEVGRGFTNAEIGPLLGLSPLTVKTHVRRIMSKLAARDRVQLVITAYETGLVRPSQPRPTAARGPAAHPRSSQGSSLQTGDLQEIRISSGWYTE
jgi:DNA-binding NarL/FixJ family response regulator